MNRPVVFADYHHGSLYHALHLLFEKRLNGTLFRPIGSEWAERGYWYINNQLSAEEELVTQRAFLEPAATRLGDDGYTRWYDGGELLEQRCMTFEQFNSVPIDLVICSYPRGERMYHRLAESRGAKLVRWLGNAGEKVDPLLSRNIIDTTRLYYPRFAMRCNCVTIHQEFPLDVFYYEPPIEHRAIHQYLNFFHKHEFYYLWQHHQKRIPQYKWREYGHQGEYGFLSPITSLAQAMRKSAFTWHVKREGYGHCLHNSFAVGRPVITMRQLYREKTAEPLLVDGVTCIDLEGKTDAEITNVLHRCSEPEAHLRTCEAVRDRFRQVVNFDHEEQLVRKFLGRLR